MVQMNQENGMEGGAPCDPSIAFTARSRQERGCTFRADCQWPADGPKFGRATLPPQDQPVLLLISSLGGRAMLSLDFVLRLA